MSKQRNTLPSRQKRNSDKFGRQLKIGKSVAEETVSSIPLGWEIFKEFYSKETIKSAEQLFADLSLNIQSVMMIQAADCLRVRKILSMMDPSDPTYMPMEKLAAQQLRHLRLMVERHGPNATKDNTLVQVPVGLILPPKNDPKIYGDDDIVK
jgi:hypothetical protein